MNQEDIADGFKMTELGPLPEEWQVVRLGDVAEKMKAGGTPSRKESSYWKGNVPFVLIEDLTSCNLYLTKTNEFITEEGLNNSSAWIVPARSILLSMYGTIGEAAINVIPVATNQAIVAIIPKQSLYPEYGAYILKFYARKLSTYNIQSTQKNVNKGIVEKFLIPLPPLPEQQKIAAVLSAVQEAKEKTEGVIRATRELKKSMMKHLFTYGPVPVKEIENVKLKETEIGQIPEHWQVVRLGDVLQLMRNGLTYRQERNHKGVPVTRIETISEGNINPNKVGYISGLDKSQIEKYRLLPGDILFSHINSEPHLGKTAIYQGNPPLILHGMNLLLLRTHPSVSDPYFLYYFLNHERAKGTFIGIAARAVGQSSINMGKLRNLPIFLPPLPEQQKIAEMMSAVDEKIRAEESKKKALEVLFKTLLHDLMTAKVRVHNLNIQRIDKGRVS